VAVVDKKPDLVDYFVTNLYDSADVCTQGRATRLIDVIAFAQDEPIVPDALVKR
jgi:hypothetical protein